MVSRRPSSSATFGSQSSAERASAMSGWRCFGSSAGSGWNTSFERPPTSFSTISASASMVNSPGLPMLMGPVKPAGVSIIRTIASMRSST